MLNQVILIGRIASDPELKVLESGKKVSEISLAVQRSFKNIDGEYDVDFIKVTLWDMLAQSIESYCKKGTMVAIKGRLQTWKLDLENEKKINMLEMVGERVTYLQSPIQKTKEPHHEKEG